jgi:predicted Zn-dependent peptidase
MSVQVSQLANGLVVVSHAMPEVETVSLGVWIGAGSRSETKNEHGVAHFLEHMAFKGTERRSAYDIAEEIEAVGGDLNASTGVDSTAYYARVMRKDLPLALDILSDIIMSPRFDPVELAREQEVVFQEIAACLDSPEDIVFDLVQEAAFPDQSLGRPILGTVKSVKGFKPNHLGAYLSAHYHAPNMVLAAAGAVDHEELVAEAERRFAALDISPTMPPATASYSGGFRRMDKSFEQTHIVLTFEAPHYRHADYFTAQMLAGVLGGGMSSRLFQEVRERRGLCYSVYAFSSGLIDSGMFTVHAASGPERAHELFAVIRDELVRAAEHGFRPEELSRVKAQLKMGLLAGLESSSARAEQLARQILIHGRVFTSQELIEKVEGIEAADMQALVERLLVSPVSLATVGPIRHVARFDAVTEKFTIPSTKAA